MQEYRRTLRIFNNYFFSTAAVLTRTLLSVMLPALFANMWLNFTRIFVAFYSRNCLYSSLQGNRWRPHLRVFLGAESSWDAANTSQLVNYLPACYGLRSTYHYHIHNSSPLVPVPGQMNPVGTSHYSFTIHFNIIRSYVTSF